MNNNHSLSKIWDILNPFIIYYVLHLAVYILLAALVQAVAQGIGNPYQSYLQEHTETVTGVVSGLSMLLSVLPLIPMLWQELAEHKKSVGEMISGQHTTTEFLLTIVLAVSASLGLNVLFALTGLVEMSAGYQDVAKQQYGVVFGAGMILYGLISPVTEEIVFRGLIFNRMRRYFPHAAAVAASGVLFGIYHGNLVQGVYGGCMGILMAYLYERLHSFLIPCLFHAMANIMVYTIAQNGALHGILFTVPGCAVLLMISAVCILGVERSAAAI